MAERWPNRNASMGPEMRYIDRLLFSGAGVSKPNGSFRGIKQPYIDFRTFIEASRINMSTDN